MLFSSNAQHVVIATLPLTTCAEHMLIHMGCLVYVRTCTCTGVGTYVAMPFFMRMYICRNYVGLASLPTLLICLFYIHFRVIRGR